MHQPDTNERIALHYVSANTPVEVVKLLLTAHAEGAIRQDKNGRTPLMLATKVGVSTAYKRGFEAIREMERAFSKQAQAAGQAPESQRDKYGKTVLHFMLLTLRKLYSLVRSLKALVTDNPSALWMVCLI